MLTMDLNLSSLIMTSNGVLLTYFVFRRWLEFRKDSSNYVNFFYFLGGGLCAVALFIYGLAAATVNTPSFSSAVATIATIINIFGFSYFFRIPAYLKLNPRTYSVFSHALTLYILLISFILLSDPAVPTEARGILYWNFSRLQSLMIVFVNGPAFLFNIILIYKSIRASQGSHPIKFATLIAAFLGTGYGGGYLYVGRNETLLWSAYLSMFFGLLILVLGTFFVERKHGEK
jgi:hypothetical protein